MSSFAASCSPVQAGWCRGDGDGGDGDVGGGGDDGDGGGGGDGGDDGGGDVGGGGGGCVAAGCDDDVRPRSNCQ